MEASYNDLDRQQLLMIYLAQVSQNNISPLLQNRLREEGFDIDTWDEQFHKLLYLIHEQAERDLIKDWLLETNPQAAELRGAWEKYLEETQEILNLEDWDLDPDWGQEENKVLRQEVEGLLKSWSRDGSSKKDLPLFNEARHHIFRRYLENDLSTAQARSLESEILQDIGGGLQSHEIKQLITLFHAQADSDLVSEWPKKAHLSPEEKKNLAKIFEASPKPIKLGQETQLKVSKNTRPRQLGSRQSYLIGIAATLLLLVGVFLLNRRPNTSTGPTAENISQNQVPVPKKPNKVFVDSSDLYKPDTINEPTINEEVGPSLLTSPQLAQMAWKRLDIFSSNKLKPQEIDPRPSMGFSNTSQGIFDLPGSPIEVNIALETPEGLKLSYQNIEPWQLLASELPSYSQGKKLDFRQIFYLDLSKQVPIDQILFKTGKLAMDLYYLDGSLGIANRALNQPNFSWRKLGQDTSGDAFNPLAYTIEKWGIFAWAKPADYGPAQILSLKFPQIASGDILKAYHWVQNPNAQTFSFLALAPEELVKFSYFGQHKNYLVLVLKSGKIALIRPDDFKESIKQGSTISLKPDLQAIPKDLNTLASLFSDT